jgi:hypothetical protein
VLSLFQQIALVAEAESVHSTQIVDAHNIKLCGHIVHGGASPS